MTTTSEHCINFTQLADLSYDTFKSIEHAANKLHANVTDIAPKASSIVPAEPMTETGSGREKLYYKLETLAKLGESAARRMRKEGKKVGDLGGHNLDFSEEEEKLKEIMEDESTDQETKRLLKLCELGDKVAKRIKGIATSQESKMKIVHSEPVFDQKAPEKRVTQPQTQFCGLFRNIFRCIVPCIRRIKIQPKPKPKPKPYRPPPRPPPKPYRRPDPPSPKPTPKPPPPPKPKPTPIPIPKPITPPKPDDEIDDPPKPSEP